MNKNKDKSAKKKKEKIIYYDDNSTISDMSGVGGTFNPIIPKSREQKSSQTYRDVQKRPSKFGDKWRTYWSTVKLMILPMCIVLGILFILFLLFMLIPTCAV